MPGLRAGARVPVRVWAPMAYGYPGGYYPPPAGYGAPPPAAYGYPQAAPGAFPPQAAYPGGYPGHAYDRQGAPPVYGYPPGDPAAAGYAGAPVYGGHAAQPGYDHRGYPPPVGALPAESSAPPRPEALVVSGCQNETVASIVHGEFALVTENHGRPVYRKDRKFNDLDVMLYYWDERDGPNFCGWWFGPKVGGDQVWAYQPDRSQLNPPPSGWKVPYDGDVDQTFAVTPKGGTQPPVSHPAGAPPGQPVSPYATSGYGAAGPMMHPPPLPYGHPGYMEDIERRRREDMQREGERMRRQAEDRRKRQEEDQKRRLEDAKKKREEAEQKKLDEQKKREEELQRVKDAEIKRKEEEMKKKREQEEKRRAEQKSTLAIRRVIQKVRLATPENFAELCSELEEILKQELTNTGAQVQRMKEESDKGIEQARKRIEQLTAQKRQEEEKRMAEENKRKEAEEYVKRLVQELCDLVDAAEKQAEKLKEIARPVEQLDSSHRVQDVEAASVAAEEAVELSKQMTKACTDFILAKGPEMKEAEAAQVVPGQPVPPSDTKQILAQLLQRINDCTHMAENTIKQARGAKAKAVQRAAAREATTAMQLLFDKYDRDSDNMLSRKEVLSYARGEFDFLVPQDTMEGIWEHIVVEGDRGVKRERFQWLRVAVGIAVERARDTRRREDRVDKERVLVGLQEELKGKIKETAKWVDEADKDVGKAEKQVHSLSGKAKTKPSSELLVLADETDAMIEESRNTVSEAREQIDNLAKGVEKRFEADLQEFLRQEAKQLECRMGRMDSRIGRATNLSVRFRASALQKRVAELEKLRAQALKVVRYHQKVKNLKQDDLFKAFDTDGDGEIDEQEWLDFFEAADKEIVDIELQLPTSTNGAVESESHLEAPEEDGANVDANANSSPEAQIDTAKPEPIKEAPLQEVKKEPTVERVELDPEQLSRLFSYLDEEGSGRISREVFSRLMRMYMKVVKEAVISNGMSIKDKQIVRRLQVDEVIEVLEGPLRENSYDVLRIRGKALEDGETGWITVRGNQGSVFLVEGGNLFKVVKETILTEAFELNGDKADLKVLLKDDTRKLKEGTILEVHEWPRIEEKSGLTRMKGKVRQDGSIGWATTVSNNGIVFLENL